MNCPWLQVSPPHPYPSLYLRGRFAQCSHRIPSLQGRSPTCKVNPPFIPRGRSPSVADTMPPKVRLPPSRTPNRNPPAQIPTKSIDASTSSLDPDAHGMIDDFEYFVTVVVIQHSELTGPHLLKLVTQESVVGIHFVKSKDGVVALTSRVVKKLRYEIRVTLFCRCHCPLAQKCVIASSKKACKSHIVRLQNNCNYSLFRLEAYQSF